jgi:hypothetical protein
MRLGPCHVDPVSLAHSPLAALPHAHSVNSGGSLPSAVT